MKSGLPIKIYALILLAVFGGIVLHAPFSVGLGTLFPSVELLIKSWKEILMFAAACLALWIVWHRRVWQELLNDRILQVAFLYIALHLLAASAFLMGTTATIAGLMIDLRYVVFFILVYVCIKLIPGYRILFLQVGAAGAAIVTSFGILQLFLPANILSHIGYGESTIEPYLTVDKNPDFIRINSTLRGPNPLGAYIVIVLGLLAAAVMRRRIDVFQPKRALMAGTAALSSLIVLWVSYSRSAVAAAGLTVFLVIVIAGRNLISRRLWIAGCIVVFALAGGIIVGREHSFVENVVLHENDEGGSAISSNEDHVASLVDGAERMLHQPIGAGIGSTGSASLMSDAPLIIENQYLFIAHEVGWFGLALFLVLFLMILHRLWQLRRDWLSLGVFASGIGLAAIGILLPVWVDDTVSIIWWGLAATCVASGGKHAGRKTNQKTK